MAKAKTPLELAVGPVEYAAIQLRNRVERLKKEISLYCDDPLQAQVIFPGIKKSEYPHYEQANWQACVNALAEFIVAKALPDATPGQLYRVLDEHFGWPENAFLVAYDDARLERKRRADLLAKRTTRHTIEREAKEAAGIRPGAFGRPATELTWLARDIGTALGVGDRRARIIIADGTGDHAQRVKLARYFAAKEGPDSPMARPAYWQPKIGRRCFSRRPHGFKTFADYAATEPADVDPALVAAARDGWLPDDFTGRDDFLRACGALDHWVDGPDVRRAWDDYEEWQGLHS